MYILKSTPSAEGQYGPILVSNQPVPPEGYVWWPDSVDQTDFIQYLGFIVPNIKRNTVASYTVNMEAYNDWVESHPDPEPEPTDTEVLNTLLGVME